jgi:hypothetical protein
MAAVPTSTMPDSKGPRSVAHSGAFPKHERLPRSPEDVLTFIDGLDEGATGHVLFVDAEGATVGVAFVEAGRLCWVAAEGLAPRLTTILIERSHGALSRARVEEVFRECQESKRPIGERLVELGLLSAGGLRAALLDHTLESLESLVAARAGLRWSARKTGGDSPQCSFSTGEVMAAFNARLDTANARVAATVVARTTGPEDLVAVFRVEDGDLGLIHLSGAATPPTWEITELASSLVLMGQITSVLDGNAGVMAFVAPAGGGVATLLANGLLYCVILREPVALSRALSRFAAEARSETPAP